MVTNHLEPLTSIGEAMPKYLCEPTSPASHALDDPPDFRTIHLDEEVTGDGMSLRSFVDEA